MAIATSVAARKRRSTKPLRTPVRRPIRFQSSSRRRAGAPVDPDPFHSKVATPRIILERLEITEGVLIDDFSSAVAILRRLKAIGVRIAMDDFGTGYSSLSYLQSFPFDKIKVDQAFISNLDRNVQSTAIVRAVIGLGHGLGLPVVAEGVETDSQLAFRAIEKCDEFQGYLLGRPQPIEEYAAATHKSPPRGRKLSRAV